MSKSHAQSLTLVALTLLPLGNLAAQRNRGGRDRQEPELVNYTFETVALDEQTERRPRVQMGVYLPKSYSDPAHKDTVYPWALWLHGRNENHRKFHVDGGARILDELRGKNEIPEFVLVALSVGNPVYVDGTAGDQETLITDKLPTFLTEKYRLAKDRAHRAIMGVSMGGFGALKIALRHPDLFAAVAAHSSALMPAKPSELPPQYQRMVQRMLESGGLDQVFGNPIDEVKWSEHMPLALAATMEVDKLKQLQIYFDVGSNDRYQFAPPNQALHALLDKRGVAHQFELVDGGGHSWGSGSLQKQLYKSLRFVGSVLAGKVPGASTDDAEPAPAGNGKQDAQPTPAQPTPTPAGAGKR
ncbi:MAG: alpha/beta hydrolase-fold protein [Planctomycetota bacterium]